MNTLVEQARSIARLFRLGKSVEAESQLPEFVDSFSRSEGINTGDLTAAVSCVLAAQERRDWFSVADYLEYEIVHILQS